MEEQLVNRVKVLRDECKKILIEMEPLNEQEWCAFDSITKAHKMFRVIEYGKLGQLPLPTGKPDRQAEPVVCPLCKGSCQIVEERHNNENGGVDLVHTPCPKCRGAGKISAEQLSLDGALENVGEGEDAEDHRDGLLAEAEATGVAAFESLGTERDTREAADAAAKAGESGPVDLSRLRVKMGQEGGRHLIHLNGTSVTGKELRPALVRLFQKLSIIERPDQLEAAIAAFPESEGKKIALAIANRTYSGEEHQPGDSSGTNGNHGHKEEGAGQGTGQMAGQG